MMAAGVLGALSVRFLPLVIPAASILALVALRRGPWSGVGIALGAGFLTFLGAFVVPTRPGLEWPAAIFVWPVVLLAAQVLRVGESPGRALLAIALVCSTAMVAMHAAVGDLTAYWTSWLGRLVSGVKGATVKGFEEEGAVLVMTGVVATVVAASAILALWLGRWMQSLLYRPGGFAAEFHRMRISPQGLALLAVLPIAGLLLRSSLLAESLMLGALICACLGLGVLHGMLEHQRLPAWWSIPIYAMLLFSLPSTGAGLALLGLLDLPLDMRGLRKNRGAGAS
jgi:hypothetical protein